MAHVISTVVLPTVTAELLVRSAKSSMSLYYARGPDRRGHDDKEYFCASAPVWAGRLHGEDGEKRRPVDGRKFGGGAPLVR
jgi:hypothetical protein